jgi:hypothetical protein
MPAPIVTNSEEKYFRGIERRNVGILKISASRDAVDNRGEDLRFPISSSSGFSSPMKGAHRNVGPGFFL